MADFASDKTVILPATCEDEDVFHDIRRALQELGYAMSAPDPTLFIKNHEQVEVLQVNMNIA